MEVETRIHDLQATISSETWWLNEFLGLTLIWGELLVCYTLQKETTILLLKAFSTLTFYPKLPKIPFRILCWIILSSSLLFSPHSPILCLLTQHLPSCIHMECLSLRTFKNKGLFHRLNFSSSLKSSREEASGWNIQPGYPWLWFTDLTFTLSLCLLFLYLPFPSIYFSLSSDYRLHCHPCQFLPTPGILTPAGDFWVSVAHVLHEEAKAYLIGLLW